MPVQCALDLDRGNVLATRYYNVLGPIPDFNGAIGVSYRQIATVKEPSGEGRLRRRLVFEITGHERVTANPDLAYRGAITRHLRTARVDDQGFTGGGMGNALTREAL